MKTVFIAIGLAFSAHAFADSGVCGNPDIKCDVESQCLLKKPLCTYDQDSVNIYAVIKENVVCVSKSGAISRYTRLNNWTSEPGTGPLDFMKSLCKQISQGLNYQIDPC